MPTPRITPSGLALARWLADEREGLRALASRVEEGVQPAWRLAQAVRDHNRHAREAAWRFTIAANMRRA